MWALNAIAMSMIAKIDMYCICVILKTSPIFSVKISPNRCLFTRTSRSIHHNHFVKVKFTLIV